MARRRKCRNPLSANQSRTPDRSVFSKAAYIAKERPHHARPSMPHNPTSKQSKFTGDPGDLVIRALGILTEDHLKSGETRPTDLPLQRRILSDGTECPLPIRYFDVQCLVATFLCDLGRAAELLKSTGLLPVAQEDGQGVVMLYCIEYRITDIGPYNEGRVDRLGGV
jgi:hypothetical protein